MGAPERSRGRILVVDDEAPVRRMLEKRLQAEGYEVVAVASGREALAQLWEHGADTVLLDLMMPDMDGIEVCRRIRADVRTTHAPIIFITAVDDRDLRRQGRHAGADDFITKPFDDSELLARVRNGVRVKRYYDGLEREKELLRTTIDARTRELDEASARLERAQEGLRIAQQETVDRLARAAEFRDDETASHLQRMSRYSSLLAERAGLPRDHCDLLQMASPMHDVGKLGIPDHILLKPARLSLEEFEIMKQHAEIGYRILSGSKSELVQLAATIAYTHHEKWDGTGYPHRLAGAEIPIEGRIAAIADVFDALTSRRPYKAAWSVEQSLDLMGAGRGSHFDPELLDLFAAERPGIEAIRLRFQEG